MSSSSAPKLSLTLKKKKSKTAAVVAPEFEAAQPGAGSLQDDSSYRRDTDGPLVIPVGENKLKFQGKKTKDAAIKEEEPAADAPSKGMSSDDAAALQALQQEASHGTSSNAVENNRNLVIEGNRNTFQGSNKNKNNTDSNETQQYKADLEALPDELPTDSESFQRVPIAEFGAALLRGMGWSGGGSNNKKKDEDVESMPRPHRLGLGAIPKLDTSMLPSSSSSSGRRALRPDQVKRQEALERQQQEYAQQRKEQLARDKQRTLQNQSLIQLTNGRRAEILQLVGVPGLNMVKIQCEGEAKFSVVKRGDIGDLLSREELDEKPFRSVALGAVSERKEKERSRDDRRSDGESGHRREKDSSTRSSRDDTHPDISRKDRKRDRDRDRDSDKTRSSRDTEERQSSKRHRDEPSKPQWVIPNIRVRVITEKLGRRYYKEKGIVVDVTPKGATVQLSGGAVLDRVPERYLETALPKQGGKAVVLAGDHRFAKGRLLERDSRRSKGVIQVFEDMNVLTLSLDDMAEWCGPLDDDLGV